MKISAMCDRCGRTHPMKKKEIGKFYSALLQEGWLIGTTQTLCPDCRKRNR